jgi:aryl-alcohol dehydrogenase-like predicted oxidoreductase
MKTLSVADLRGYHRFVSQQIHYTPQAREAEFELLPAGMDQGVGSMVWSPLAGGLLSGKHRRDQQSAEGSRHVTEWGGPPVYDQNKLYDIVEVLVKIGQAHSVSAAQVTLAWLLTRPTVATLVIAARTEEQLIDNLAAVDLGLSDDEVAEIEAVSRPDLPYPLWHQAANASDRLSAADRAVLGPWLN